VLLNLGNVAFVRGDLRAARKLYQDVAELSVRLGDLVNYGESLLLLGGANVDLLAFKEALANYRQARRVTDPLDREGLKARLCIAEASILHYLGDLGAAEEGARAAIAGLAVAKEAASLAAARRKLAMILGDLGRFEEGLVEIARSLEAGEGFPNQLQASALVRVELLADAGRNDEARGELETFRRGANFNQSDPAVRLRFARLDSRLSPRPDPSRLGALKLRLGEEASAQLLRDRLPALVEALEHGSDPSLLIEAKTLATRIRAALPEERRGRFDARPYVRRLGELTAAMG
jgi:tetratricopeptide (TPR) repeat protein